MLGAKLNRTRGGLLQRLLGRPATDAFKLEQGLAGRRRHGVSSSPTRVKLRTGHSLLLPTVEHAAMATLSICSRDRNVAMVRPAVDHPRWRHAPMSAPSLDAPQTAPPRYPPAPDGHTLYLVGDIHGRLDLLLRVQRQIDEDKARNDATRTLEIYLGDYIDRGSDSAGVVSRLIARAGEVDTAFLRGNHEQLLLDFLQGSDCAEQWSGLGGTATLLSYGVAPRVLSREASADVIRSNLSKKLPHDHVRFYEETGSYARIGDYLAVHAGLRPGFSLEDQKTADLLGIRRDFLDYEGDFGFIVIHGHTPVMAPELRHNRINIDTGAFATNRLTCLRIGADGARILQSDRRASDT